MTPLKKGGAGFVSGKKSSQNECFLVCRSKEYGDFRTKVGNSHLSFFIIHLFSVDSLDVILRSLSLECIEVIKSVGNYME